MEKIKHQRKDENKPMSKIMGMSDEEFIIKKRLQKPKRMSKPKRISYLKEGDKVWIVSSEGYLLHVDTVTKVRGSYVEIDRILYWRRGLDGKHRNRNNYMQFAITPEDGKRYVIYYPDWFKE